MKEFNVVWTSPTTSEDEGGGGEEDLLNEEDDMYLSGFGDIFSVTSSRFDEKPDELDKEVMESIRQFSHGRIQWWIRSQQEKPIRLRENVFALQKLPTLSSILSSFETQDACMTTSHLEHEEPQKEALNDPTTESSPVWSVITPHETTTLSIDQIMKEEEEEQNQKQQRLVMEENSRLKHHHHSSFRHPEDHRRRHREGTRQSLLLSSSTNHHQLPSRPSLLSSSSSSSPIPSSTTRKPTTVHEEPRLHGGGNKKWELLCIRQKHHDPECRFAHSFEEWNPKKCKYQKKCSRKDQCCFWHAEIESKRQYLIRTLRGADGYFRKHRDDYIHTYHLRM